MKKYLLIWCFLLTIIAGNAQDKTENKVASAVDALRSAMISGDRTALGEITADQLTYGHSGGKMEDKSTFIESLATGKSDFVTMDLTEQKIIVSGKTALVRHKLSAKINDSGVPGTVGLGVLLVFQKQHGGWKLLARQAYKL